MIWTKGAHQNEKSQTFACLRKISPKLYFDRLLKANKILAKKYRRVSPEGLMALKNDAKFEEKLIFFFKNDKNLVKLDLSTLKSSKVAFSFAPIVKSI